MSEELNTLTAEDESVKEKLTELTEEELAEVSGGDDYDRDRVVHRKSFG